MKQQRHSLKEIVGGGYTTFWNEREKRYIAIKGSRGSKKSKTVALRFITLMEELGNKALEEGTDAFPSMVVIRRYWNTHRDSTRAELVWAINRLGSEKYWKIPKGDLTLTYIPTGQVILFRGMDDVQSITSITVSVGYLCFVWFEEFFQVVSESDFDKVDMSIRGRLPDGLFHQIVMTFNPWSDRHFAKKRFFDVKDDDVLALTTTYKQNEFLSEKDIARYEKMKIQNPRRYRIEGLGEWGIAEGLIFENWHEEDFDIDELIEKNRGKRTARGQTAFFQCCGLDFGYTDPTAFVALYADIKDYKLYVYHEMFEIQMENRKIAGELMQDGFGDCVIMADSEDPRTIRELSLLGLHGIRGAKKGSGSVLGGIQKLQDYEIIVHPRCQHFIESICNYAWKKDRITDKILPEPEHEFSHLMDAMRYATENLQRFGIQV